MEEEKAVRVAGVGVEAGDWYVLAEVEFEFLWCDAVIFAGFLAGEDFFGKVLRCFADVIGEVFCRDRCGFVVFFVFVAPGVAAVEGLFFCEGIVVLGF